MGVDAAITLVLALLDRAAAISALIQSAQAAGRTALTTAEWQTITAADDAAMAALKAAIAKAQAEGR
jgi:ABC-type transporter Mla MlaB component